MQNSLSQTHKKTQARIVGLSFLIAWIEKYTQNLIYKETQNHIWHIEKMGKKKKLKYRFDFKVKLYMNL